MLSPGSDSAVEVELFTPPKAVFLPALPEGRRKARFPCTSWTCSDTSAGSAKPRVKVLTPTAKSAQRGRGIPFSADTPPLLLVARAVTEGGGVGESEDPQSTTIAERTHNSQPLFHI